LQKYPSLHKKPVAVFHDFVPVHFVSPQQSEERFILSVGYPWFTKGMDVLIRAFKLIAAQFPEYKLRLMGYFPDREFLTRLAADCPQIEFLSPRPNELALKVIGACSIYVLASRTEGMPLVLLEAMAARKPIIASAVGGVPYCIRDNDNGLLFQSENVEELATKLASLLRNQELQKRLANSGYERVFFAYDERSYVRSFNSMLQSLRDESFVHHIADGQHDDTPAETPVDWT
jgi:glycosyltransferase involved in cell wall biosynthesis